MIYIRLKKDSTKQIKKALERFINYNFIALFQVSKDGTCTMGMLPINREENGVAICDEVKQLEISGYPTTEWGIKNVSKKVANAILNCDNVWFIDKSGNDQYYLVMNPMLHYSMN